MEAHSGDLGIRVLWRDFLWRFAAAVSGCFSVVGKLGYTSLKVRFTSDDDTLVEDDVLYDRLSGVRAALGFHYGDDTDKTYYGAEYRHANYEEGVIRH